MSAAEGDEAEQLDDKDLDELYRRDSGAGPSRLHRQGSRTSANSVGSTASGSSDDYEHSRRSSTSSDARIHRHSTSEMGIQTTLGRTSQAPDTGEDHNANSASPHKKERKPSKMKKLFRRKSGTGNGEVEGMSSLPELPQGFICKYMGKRACKGLWGSKHTRGPVEEIVDAIGKLPKGEDLPLVNLDVHPQGLAMRPHTKNKVKCYKPVQIPIQFISYGLQDTVYPRIFCFIMVTEMSSQKKSMECHVYACDSAKSARNLASCLALAFQSYSEQLQGGPFKFSVNIDMEPVEETDSCDV